MNCIRCGSQLTENDQFCKGCGAATNNTSAQTINASNFTAQGQQPVSQQSVVQQPVAQQPVAQQPIAQPSVAQQPIPQQQTWANSYNGQPSYNQMPTKKDGNGKFIIIGVIAAVVILVGILAFTMLSNKNGDSSNDGNGVAQNNSTSTYKVNFKGFEFKIPTNLVYETESNAIVLGDEDGTWAAAIEVVDGAYSQILKNKSQLQSVYTKQGYKASSAVEKTYGGMNFITLELTASGQNLLLGITKANSMSMFGITAYNVANEFDYNLLTTLSKILKNSEYTGKTNNMAVNKKVDFSAIPALAK